MGFRVQSIALGLSMATWLLAGSCSRTPADDFHAFIEQVTDTATGEVLPDPDDAAVTPDAAGDFGAGSVDLTGSFVFVFQTELQSEPRGDVVLVLTQQGAIPTGGAVVSGEALSLQYPDVVLGTIPEVSIPPEGAFDLEIADFLIPPGQEALLPDGGTAEILMHVQIVDDALFCGDIDFHLLEPLDLHQEGEFACYRKDVIEPGGPRCPE